MHWILLLIGPLAWSTVQTVQDAEPSGSVQPFWMGAAARTEPFFSPYANLPSGPWQTKYSFNGEKLVLGGKSLAENDARFPARGEACRETPGEDIFSNSVVRFCWENEIPAALTKVNGEVSTAQGVLALTEGQPLIFETLWKSGKKIRISLSAPREPIADIKRKTAGGWSWTEFNGPFRPRGKTFGAPSFPWTQGETVLEINEFPYMLRRRGPLGAVFEKIISSGEEVPLPAARAAYSVRRRLGGYGDETEFRLRGKKGREAWRIRSEEYGHRWFTAKNEEGLWGLSRTRMPGSELSGRFSGLLGSSALIVTGEALFAHQFENPFGGGRESWNSHRWGTRLRGFGSLTGLNGLQLTKAPQLMFASGELRMLARQGIWNLDDIWGVLVSVNQFQLIDSQQSFLGAGIFWSRSMPDGFDRWLRWSRLFRFPKYVDLDLAYLNPTTKSAGGLNWIANFHGKMFVAEQWFVEGGVGFFQLETQTGRRLSASLGTFGFGVLF